MERHSLIHIMCLLGHTSQQWHVIVMHNTHFGMATHKALSQCHNNNYDNHMQATSRESDWYVTIKKQAPESARCVPDLPCLRAGSGDETRSVRENPQNYIVIANQLANPQSRTLHCTTNDVFNTHSLSGLVSFVKEPLIFCKQTRIYSMG